MHKKGQIDNDGAEAVLGPIMESERAFIAFNALAYEKAERVKAELRAKLSE